MVKRLSIALFIGLHSLAISQEIIELETFVVTAQYEKTEKEKAIKEHQGEKAIGESWLLHHLRILRKSLEE